MKKLLVSALMGVVSFAFAVNALAIDYTGNGQWKSNKGGTGDYAAKLSVNPNGDDLVISNEISWGDTVMKVQFTVRRVDDTFFKVISNGNVIGGGYCWPVADARHGDKVCQYGGKALDGWLIEETMYITANTISRMGSKFEPTTHLAITWNDQLSMVNGSGSH